MMSRCVVLCLFVLACCFVNCLGTEVKNGTVRNALTKAQQKVAPDEYLSFMITLKHIQESRNRTMVELERTYGQLLVDHKRNTLLSGFTERRYNFSTGVTFEEEFSCDLDQLTSCEAELLQNIELIKGSTEEEVPQLEVLQVCKSMDDEFSCLVSFAEKCENSMTFATFSLLRFIIQHNKQTLVTCEQRELDWIGFEDVSQHQLKTPEQWQDSKGIWHVVNPAQTSPCLESFRIQNCLENAFGFEFDLGRDSIRSLEDCENAFKFEHCLMKELFDFKPYATETNSLPCTVDIRGLTLNFLLSTLRWDLDALRHDTQTSAISFETCQIASHSWSQAVDYGDKLTSCQKMTDNYAHQYTSLLTESCFNKTQSDVGLCFGRFQTRIQNLWLPNREYERIGEDFHRDNSMCCVTGELAQCLETFVLVRCGLSAYLSYRDELEAIRLNTLSDSCVKLQYSTQDCRDLLSLL